MLQNKSPVFILNTQAEREHGRKAQLSNIIAGKSVGDLIRTTLGPRSMLKMLLDPMGGIVITSDGNAILREIDVTHPAAKSMIEIARAQDEQVGDGTTSVIILTSEILAAAQPFLQRQIHPTVIVSSYYRALQQATKLTKELSTPIDQTNDPQILYKIVKACIGTKFVSQWGDMITRLAVDAVQIVKRETSSSTSAGASYQIDTKRYAKIEKIPGGILSDCKVLDGVMFNKDVTHAQMPRFIKNPRVVLLDSPLQYKKGESMTNMEMMAESDFSQALRMEVQEVKKMCDHIVAMKPDVVITEKGVSDLAQHYIMKQGGDVAVIRRIRKTDNNRIARVTGATIVNRPEELQESDVGKECGLFEIKKFGDQYFTFMVECKNPKACTILLRGGSKDVLNQVERNMHDAMAVARNVMIEPKLVPGGGALEMQLAAHLTEKAKNIEGISQWPFKAIASAFQVIPRTLAQNSGADVVREMTKLRAKHSKKDSEDGKFYGIDGEKGTIADMRDTKVWDPVSVKLQTFKTAIQTASMILRIDDIISGMKKGKGAGGQQQQQQDIEEPEETFGDARDG